MAEWRPAIQQLEQLVVQDRIAKQVREPGKSLLQPANAFHDVRPLAQELFRQARCRYLILKLGERGLMSYRSPGYMPREFFTIDSFVDHLVDPVGAGDALLAYATLALAAKKSIVVAATLGAVGAAVACERQGNAPVSPGEVGDKIDALERLARYD